MIKHTQIYTQTRCKAVHLWWITQDGWWNHVWILKHQVVTQDSVLLQGVPVILSTHCRPVTCFVGVVSRVLPVHLVLGAVAVFIRMDHPVVLKGDGHWTQTSSQTVTQIWKISHVILPLFVLILILFCCAYRILYFIITVLWLYLCFRRWTSSPPGGADHQTHGRTASAASWRASSHWSFQKPRLTTTDLLQDWRRREDTNTHKCYSTWQKPVWLIWVCFMSLQNSVTSRWIFILNKTH